MNFRFPALVCVCLAGMAAGSGCSVPPVPTSMACCSATESASVSEGDKNGSCVADISVQETVNGKTHTLHAADVPCRNSDNVEAKLITQAKQGL